jgi:hypothetical protein
LPERKEPLTREISPYGTISLSLPADEEAKVIEHLQIYGGRSLSSFVGYRKENPTVKTPIVYHDKEINYDSVQIGVDLVKQTAQNVANEQLADSTAASVRAAEQKTGKIMMGSSGVQVIDENGNVVSEVTK